MRFIGPPFTFGLAACFQHHHHGSECGSSHRGRCMLDGHRQLLFYAGQTQQLPCTVKDKVFLDFNLEQADKVVSGVNSEFSEVFWFYPLPAAPTTTNMSCTITAKKFGILDRYREQRG